jgi:hypothetical protein
MIKMENRAMCSEWFSMLCMLSTNGTLFIQGDQVHYEGELSPSFKQQLSEYRQDIELWFRIDALAKRSGWIQLEWGQAYEMQVSKTSYVYLFNEKKGWMVWRGVWVTTMGKSAVTPLRDKVVASGLTFEEALAKGNNYVKWWRI